MIRKMRYEDLDEVTEIEKELFTNPWSRESFMTQLLKSDNCKLFVYDEDGVIKGVCGFWQIYERADIITIGVRKAYQHQGIGKALMEAMIEEAKELNCEVMSLEVRVSNEIAIHMYESYGFIKIRVREGYYSDNHEDAYEMMRAL